MIDARYETAKRGLRQWAEPAYRQISNQEIGANPATLAPQHALWVLEYVELLEKRLAELGPKR